MAEPQKDQWAVVVVAVIILVVCVLGLSGVRLPKGNHAEPTPPRNTYTEAYNKIDWKQVQLDEIQQAVDDIRYEQNRRH